MKSFGVPMLVTGGGWAPIVLIIVALDQRSNIVILAFERESGSHQQRLVPHSQPFTHVAQVLLHPSKVQAAATQFCFLITMLCFQVSASN